MKLTTNLLIRLIKEEYSLLKEGDPQWVAAQDILRKLVYDTVSKKLPRDPPVMPGDPPSHGYQDPRLPVKAVIEACQKMGLITSSDAKTLIEGLQMDWG